MITSAYPDKVSSTPMKDDVSANLVKLCVCGLAASRSAGLIYPEEERL